MKILISGFDAFGKDTYNPSYEAILNIKSHDLIDIVKVQLPTKYNIAGNMIIDRLQASYFDYVFLVGQAAGRKEITLEKYALNTMNSSIEDNAGFKPIDLPVIENKDSALESSIDLLALSSYLNNKDFISKVSYHAGTFVCNSTYYEVLNYIKENNLKTEAVFIHVPITPEQRSSYEIEHATMTLSEITDALASIIDYFCIK